MTKTCSCGAAYDLTAWKTLHLVGYERDPPLTLELRNCGLCKSTLGVLIDGRGNYVEAHPDDTPI